MNRQRNVIMQMAIQETIRRIAGQDVSTRRRPDGAIIITPQPRPGVLAVPWDDKYLFVQDGVGTRDDLNRSGPQRFAEDRSHWGHNMVAELPDPASAGFRAALRHFGIRADGRF